MYDYRKEGERDQKLRNGTRAKVADGVSARLSDNSESGN